MGCLPFYPDPRCTHYLDENVALLRPRGVCELRAMSGAAPLRTGSSPGCAAAGSPGSYDLRGAAPSRSCSAAGSSPLLRWRSSGSRYRPRYRRRCFQRCRSWRNDRSQIETATESSGGPWLERRRAVVDECDEGRTERWTDRSPAPNTASPFLSTHRVTSDDDRRLRVFSEAFTAVILNNEKRYLEAAGSHKHSPRMSHKHHLHRLHSLSLSAICAGQLHENRFILISPLTNQS